MKGHVGKTTIVFYYCFSTRIKVSFIGKRSYTLLMSPRYLLLRYLTYPIMLRQTFPFMYRLGLNLTVPPPVVSNFTRGGS